jgi:hypothetical protein
MISVTNRKDESFSSQIMKKEIECLKVSKKREKSNNKTRKQTTKANKQISKF